MLRAGAGVGLAALIPGIACGNGDEEVFAGATTEPPTPTAVPTNTPVPTPTPEEAPTSEPEAQPEAAETPTVSQAVNGEFVVSFTYTQAAGGKNERPYVAVWLEDTAGELVETVALWYEQGRRGERWLDHLTRWYDSADQANDADSGATTISSATREPGSYTVAWDGLVAGTPVVAGDYVVCIEAAREDGPHSLICEPVSLTGSLASTPLPDDSELSAVSIRIDG